MSADLDHVAAYITERFTGPLERITEGTGSTAGYPERADWFARPATTPETADPGPPAWDGAPAPAASPGAEPTTAPHEVPSPQQEAGPDEEAAPGTRAVSRAMPATAPGEPRTRPARPATSPARRPDSPARPRQYRTMRVFAGSIAALVAVAVGTGAYQLATRGYTFFVFRSAGTGSTDNNAVFPGIIPTPTPSPAHHHEPAARGRHAAGEAQHHHRHTGGTHHRAKGQ
jgi:hypothetical protein